MSWHKLLTAQEFLELKILFGNVYMSQRDRAKTMDLKDHTRIFELLGLSLNITYRYNRFGTIQLILTTEFLTVNYVHSSDYDQFEKRHVFLIEAKTRHSRMSNEKINPSDEQ